MSTYRIMIGGVPTFTPRGSPLTVQLDLAALNRFIQDMVRVGITFEIWILD